MNERQVPERFLVAFSFAGEQRELVRGIATRLEERLGSSTVFFDEWYEFWIAGADADLRLRDVYRDRSELAVVCVSSDHGRKPWTRVEHDAIRARQMQLGPQDQERILPLRVGDGDVRGIEFNAICPDVRHRPVEDTVTLIINRLRRVCPNAVPSITAPPRVHERQRVLLAECTPDLEDREKPINRHRLAAFIEQSGWGVLPERPYPTDDAHEYRALLERDLRNSVAFVQLLGPYPWKRGGYDRLQNEVAVAAGIPRFRYRSADITIENVDDAAHRSLLSESDVIACGFEDFKVLIKDKLTVFAHRNRRVKEVTPSVLVVIRSGRPDLIWDRIFQWLYEEEQIHIDCLRDDQTIEAKSAAEPFHGYLVACDGGALEDSLSPRAYLQDCRKIQLQVQDAERLPPVGLVYWPPPAPTPWPRLLQSIPKKLHRFSVDPASSERPDFAEFCAAVRSVAG